MSYNVGGIDRILRIIIGSLLIAVAVITGNILGWVGLIPLLTGVFKFCPTYAIFGFKTSKVDSSQQ